MPKVLLADDSTHAQRMGTKILTGDGIEVVTVSNGEAAVKKLTPEFDVVLADVFMPGRTGYEVCSFIKNSRPLSHIPVILVVGNLEPYDPEQAQKVHADGVIKKPFEASVVLKTVHGLIEAAKRRKPAPAAPPPPPPVEEAHPEHHEPSPVTTTAPLPPMEVPLEMQGSAIGFEEATAEMMAPPPAMEPVPEPPLEAPPEIELGHVEPAPAAPVAHEEAPVVMPAAPEPPAPAAVHEETLAAPPPEPLVAPEVAPATPEESEYDINKAVAAAKDNPPAVPEIPEVFESAAAPAPVEATPPAAGSAAELEVEPAQPGAVEVVAAPVPRLVAVPEAVTDADRSVFAPPPAPVAAATAAPARPTAPAAEVPDWADLLKSVEESAPPKPKAGKVSKAKAGKAETTEAAATPAPAVSSDEARLRAAIENGLDKALPGVKAVPGLVDTLTAEVLRVIAELAKK